jgi:hypothetical protein
VVLSTLEEFIETGEVEAVAGLLLEKLPHLVNGVTQEALESVLKTGKVPLPTIREIAKALKVSYRA